MILNPPTPLQWKALQESVVVHRNQYSSQEEEKHDDNHNNEIKFATIDAAPLVAIIDEYTGKR